MTNEEVKNLEDKLNQGLMAKIQSAKLVGLYQGIISQLRQVSYDKGFASGKEAGLAEAARKAAAAAK